jgi:hypothetical protein
MPAPFRYPRAVVRIAVAAIALLLATCAAAATPTPNVRGVVVGGPVTVCPPGEPCDPSPKAIFVAFSRAGHSPVRARIGPTGLFALYLRPARYAIRLSPPQGARLTPTSVRVPARGVVRLRLVVR